MTLTAVAIFLATLLLVISNLTNILTADYFNLGFFAYARTMFWPNLVSVAASIAVLWLFFGRDIPRRVGDPPPGALLAWLAFFGAADGRLLRRRRLRLSHQPLRSGRGAALFGDRVDDEGDLDRAHDRGGALAGGEV